MPSMCILLVVVVVSGVASFSSFAFREGVSGLALVVREDSQDDMLLLGPNVAASAAI